MPRLLAVGHVTWDRFQREERLGGTAAYAALAASKLGWRAAVLTAAGPDFAPERDLPGVEAFVEPSAATTRFRTSYDADGGRRQTLESRAQDVALTPLPDAWRAPEVLLLGPVAGELRGAFAQAFEAQVVGATVQGWLREFAPDGDVSPREWTGARAELTGVHVVFLSERDVPNAGAWARERLAEVPVVAVTRGWEGVRLFTREFERAVPGLPRTEADPTGAGDVFAAAFLMSYHESGDLTGAAAFANCAASCAVEAPGAMGLGDRAEVERRLRLRQRLLDEGEWDE